MKRFLEQLKPTTKLVGIIIGAFILWTIFNLNFQNKTNPLREEKSTPLMMGLNKNNQSDMMFSEKRISESAVDSIEMPTTEPALIEKKEIKNGDLNLKVEKIDDAITKISAIAENQNGEVSSTNFYERIKGQKSGYINIKVPVEKFETTLSQIKTVATQIISESTSGQDVTEQYSDLKIQLKNKEAEEQSFLKILNQANKVEDVLAVTREISRTRGEIEQLQGQIKFMDSQTDLSSITVELSEDIEIAPIQKDWRPWQVAKKAFSDLINNLQNFVNGIIRFIIVGIPSLIPFVLFFGIIYWIGKIVWTKIKK